MVMNQRTLFPIQFFLFDSFIEASNFSADGSPEDAIQGLIKYYVILGFSSIFLYWVAWSTWLIAAERQTRRIRFVIELLKLIKINRTLSR